MGDSDFLTVSTATTLLVGDCAAQITSLQTLREDRACGDFAELVDHIIDDDIDHAVHSTHLDAICSNQCKEPFMRIAESVADSDGGEHCQVL